VVGEDFVKQPSFVFAIFSNNNLITESEPIRGGIPNDVAFIAVTLFQLEDTEHVGSNY